MKWIADIQYEIWRQKNEVYAVDIVPEKVDMINAGKSPIIDKQIEEYLANKKLNLTATVDCKMAYKDAEFIIIISTPTNYDPTKNYFDTSGVEGAIKENIDKLIMKPTESEAVKLFAKGHKAIVSKL